jgi:hypothetical protein
LSKAKRYLVLGRTQKIVESGIQTGKGHRRFRRRSGFYVSDPAEAREIEQKYGKKGTKDVNVVEDDRAAWHINADRSTDGNHATHHYTFGPTASYAAAWEAFEKRRKDNRRKR